MTIRHEQVKIEELRMKKAKIQRKIDAAKNRLEEKKDIVHDQILTDIRNGCFTHDGSHDTRYALRGLINLGRIKNVGTRHYPEWAVNE